MWCVVVWCGVWCGVALCGGVWCFVVWSVVPYVAAALLWSQCSLYAREEATNFQKIKVFSAMGSILMNIKGFAGLWAEQKVVCYARAHG